MAWHAKPSGSYEYYSAEGKANIEKMNAFFNKRNYTLESQAGIIGNVVGESGLNPWRWQSDTYNLSGGYGLFQFTPASEYISKCKHLAYFAPNYSVTERTKDAYPSDGNAQLTAFADDILGKWTTTCWRPYWDTTEYADLYNLRTNILNTYGNGSALTMSQFMSIEDVYEATFAFLACFEGPAIPNMSVRYMFATGVYEYLLAGTPDEPTPTTKRRKKSIFMNSKFATICRRFM